MYHMNITNYFYFLSHDRKSGVIVMLSNLLEGNEFGDRNGHEGKDSKVETFWKNGRRERGWNKRRRSKKRWLRNESGREMCKMYMIVAWREFEYKSLKDEGRGKK